MPLPELIKQINLAGWFINNLSQLDAYSWRASLRSENLMFLIADGDTPEGALERALANTNLPGFSIHDKRLPFGTQHLSLDDLGL